MMQSPERGPAEKQLPITNINYFLYFSFLETFQLPRYFKVVSGENSDIPKKLKSILSPKIANSNEEITR